MDKVDLAHARERLDELVARVEAGESFDITREGKSVARLSAPIGARKPVDIEFLRSVTATMQPQHENAGEFVRAMRDGDRF